MIFNISLLEPQKIIVLIFILQAFIFIVKNILFSDCKDQEVFEELQKYADKEVKRLREQGRYLDAWEIAVK